MASLRTQNALLFVIAVCLVLLVVHFYSGHLVDKAQAATVARSGEVSQTALFGCYDKGASCAWTAVRVDPDGFLLTAPK